MMEEQVLMERRGVTHEREVLMARGKCCRKSRVLWGKRSREKGRKKEFKGKEIRGEQFGAVCDTEGKRKLGHFFPLLFFYFMFCFPQHGLARLPGAVKDHGGGSGLVMVAKDFWEHPEIKFLFGVQRRLSRVCETCTKGLMLILRRQC